MAQDNEFKDLIEDEDTPVQESQEPQEPTKDPAEAILRKIDEALEPEPRPIPPVELGESRPEGIKEGQRSLGLKSPLILLRLLLGWRLGLEARQITRLLLERSHLKRCDQGLRPKPLNK
jgi:hypothetical protein